MADMTFDDAINIAKGAYSNDPLTMFLIEVRDRVAELERDNAKIILDKLELVRQLEQLKDSCCQMEKMMNRIKRLKYYKTGDETLTVYEDNAAMRALLKHMIESLREVVANMDDDKERCFINWINQIINEGAQTK